MFYIHVRAFVMRSPLAETKGIIGTDPEQSQPPAPPAPWGPPIPLWHQALAAETRQSKHSDGDWLNRGDGVSEEAAKIPHD